MFRMISVHSRQVSIAFDAQAGTPQAARMTAALRPMAIVAAEAPLRVRSSSYPEPFASRMEGRSKRPLGDVFGLVNFGVNFTCLEPGAVSSLRHAHSRQDEFVYVLEGEPTLVTDHGESQLSPGMCAGFRAGSGIAHQVVNRSGKRVVILEVGNRSAGDSTLYPADDLQAHLQDGRWVFSRKEGSGIWPRPSGLCKRSIRMQGMRHMNTRNPAVLMWVWKQRRRAASGEAGSLRAAAHRMTEHKAAVAALPTHRTAGPHMSCSGRQSDPLHLLA